MKNKLHIDGLSHDLRGVGRVEGKTCFIPGTLPGETASVQIKQNRRRFIEAEAINIITASQDRVVPECSIYEQCGGCDFQYCDGEKQLHHKQDVLLQQFSRLAKAEPQELLPPITSVLWGYRRRARLSCRWNKKLRTLQLGFRAKNSKEIVSLTECPVLEPQLSLLLLPLAELLKNIKDKKSIGHIELVSGENIAVLIRQLNDWKEEDQLLIERFSEENQLMIYSQKESHSGLSLIANPSNKDLIYKLSVDDISIEFQPGDFIQGNREVNESMISRSLELLNLESSDEVLDLFCGLGNFTLPIAKLVKKVVAIEGNKKMVERATKNAQINRITNIEFSTADLANLETIPALKKLLVNKVLLDPPRDGAAQVCQQLAKLPLKKILYISCNPSTLARDAKYLVDGGFVLKSAGVVDMFPQTHHIEAMALFERP